MNKSKSKTAITKSKTNETATIKTKIAQALSQSWAGLQSVWEDEKNQRFGLSVAVFAKDTYLKVLHPLVALAWLLLSQAFAFMTSPEVREWFLVRFASESVEALETEDSKHKQLELTS